VALASRSLDDRSGATKERLVHGARSRDYGGAGSKAADQPPRESSPGFRFEEARMDSCR
jgi:hypothetical protein